MIKAKKIENIIISIVLITLLAIVFSLSILGNSNYLIYFYFIAFTIQCILFAFFMINKKARFSKKSLFLLFLYFISLFLPIVKNIFLGIDTNLYDILVIIIRFINFLLFYCIFEMSIVKKEQIRKLFKFFIIIGFISCVYNYLFCFDEIQKIVTASSSYQVNIRSFFHNRNMFGEFMFISMLSTFYYYEGKKSKAKLLLTFLFSITAFLTFSRSAIFSVFLLLIYFYIKKYGNKKINVIVLFLGFIIVAYILLGPAVKFLNIFIIRGDNFSTGRSSIWEYGYKVFINNPIVGVGNYTAVGLAEQAGFTHSQFHSFFIETLAGYGLVGLFVYAIMIIPLFKRTIHKLKITKNLYYRNCVIVSFLILFIKMFIESISFFSVGYSDLITTLFYVSIPLLLSNMDVEEKEGEEM